VEDKRKLEGLKMIETMQGLRGIVFGSEISVIEMAGLLELIKYELINSAAMTSKFRKPA